MIKYLTCTPATASITNMVPSRTLHDRSTSIVKSTCPGVSIKLMSVSFQCNSMIAELMVIPRSRSWGKKSVTVSPESTLPIDLISPAI